LDSSKVGKNFVKGGEKKGQKKKVSKGLQGKNKGAALVKPAYLHRRGWEEVFPTTKRGKKQRGYREKKKKMATIRRGGEKKRAMFYFRKKKPFFRLVAGGRRRVRIKKQGKAEEMKKKGGGKTQRRRGFWAGRTVYYVKREEGGQGPAPVGKTDRNKESKVFEEKGKGNSLLQRCARKKLTEMGDNARRKSQGGGGKGKL